GRQQLLRRIEQQVRGLETQAELRALDAHYRRAFSLLAAPEVTRAFNLALEPQSVRERYGMNIHGQSRLPARHLAEAGVPLVTVFWPNDGITNVSVYWDTHNRNFVDLKTRLCPVTDLAFSALLEDLEARGLLDETLVVWTGEMGRTPRVGQSVVGGAGAGRDGRDHWARVAPSGRAGGAPAAPPGGTCPPACWPAAAGAAAWSAAPATATRPIPPPTPRRPKT